MKDVIVVGGGPAGLATALHAARAGMEVVVRDQRAGVIDKACGEGLMPGAVAALTRIGVDPPGQELSGIRYIAGSRQVAAPFRTGPGRGIRRTTLHGAMRDAALEAGVRIEHRAVVDVRQDDESVTVDGERARYIVAADGLHSAVRRMLGLEGASGTWRRYGLRAHFHVAPWTSYVEVHWADSAEAYVTPVAADVVGVALLTSVRGPFDQHLDRFPSLRDRLRHAERIGEVLGAGPMRQRVTARVAGRALLVGDASGYVDALTGEGVALAVAQARAAVAAIGSDDPARYERDWYAVTRRYRLLTGSLLNATRLRPLRKALVPVAERFPTAFGAVVNSLGRSA